MAPHFFLDLFGYAGSALIAIAITMRSILWLRVVNSAGAAVFVVYGLLIHAYPVAVLNSFVVLVNLYYLSGMFRAQRFFQMLRLKPDSEYLAYFLRYHEREIAAILPEFKYQPVENQVTLFIVRDCAPVGIFIAEQQASQLRVILDFVIPGYRDLKLGRFMFREQAGFFRERGIREILISPRTEKFGAYLAKVGFEPADKGQGSFRIRYADKTD
jgi:hypothetical protein